MKFILLILISCGVPFKKHLEASDRNRSLNGPFISNTGSCLFNIGHRVGGDFRGLKDNHPDSAKQVRHLEYHMCFRYWEFDINRAHDGMVVYHNTSYKDKKVCKTRVNKIPGMELGNFIERMLTLSPTKPFAFDIKHIHSDDFKYLLLVASKLPVKSIFLFKRSRAKKYSKFINMLLTAKHEVRYYGKG